MKKQLCALFWAWGNGIISVIGGEYMLEVVFSDSVKGAMRMAKNYNKKAMIGGAIGYIGKKPSKAELEKQFEDEPIGGNSADVICVGNSLDVGDISEEFDNEKRKKEIKRLFGSVLFSDSEIEHFFDLQRKDYDKMLLAAKSGEHLRIWKSNTPFSVCGFAFLCDSLRDIDCKISVIALPEYLETSENAIQSYTDWGEVSPGEFYKFLDLERELSSIEKRIHGNIWKDLKIENAPLRALVNGKLISVPEDFYDHIIAKYIPDDEFVMANLIGNVLGKCPLGVGDGWYSLRIQKMIADNKLEVVGEKDATHPYSKILRKA